jgi:putative hydrolase of the HAD superfamily
MTTPTAAVLFDFYGTLAYWHESQESGYTAVFSRFGYTLTSEMLDAYFERYDGVEHAEHSVDSASYERWVRHRLADLTTACAVPLEQADEVIEGLRAADQGDMVVYPEVADTLRALRAAGLKVGVCSNWGWDLEAFLERTGLLPLVDVAVTSAQAGARKPHPSIYATALTALNVEPAQVLFVGDSWGPDVIGPTAAGMAAVHVWRPEERGDQAPPALREGDVRVPELGALLGLLGVS